MGYLLIFSGYIPLVLVAIAENISIELVEKIRRRDNATLTTIYKETFPMVRKYIITNSGSTADAQDIFQDAMYLLIKKTTQSNFTLTAKPSTFVFGISKNLWLKQLGKKSTELSDLDENIPAEDALEEKEYDLLKKVQFLKKCLLELGEPCKTILEQFYFLKTPMKQIAEMLHYTNANNAKNQKYKCFVRLKKQVMAND